jgi:hypothetical protein
MLHTTAPFTSDAFLFPYHPVMLSTAMFIRKVLNKFDYIHVKNFSPNIIIYLYWHNYGEAIYFF